MSTLAYHNTQQMSQRHSGGGKLLDVLINLSDTHRDNCNYSSLMHWLRAPDFHWVVFSRDLHSRFTFQAIRHNGYIAHGRYFGTKWCNISLATCACHTLSGTYGHGQTGAHVHVRQINGEWLLVWSSMSDRSMKSDYWYDLPCRTDQWRVTSRYWVYYLAPTRHQ